MEQTHHLSELTGIVAAVRAQGRTVRIVVRNVDRLGLLHLYFAAGRLAHVEGHAGNASLALRDLATWYHGAVRLDAVASPVAPGADTMALDGYLDLALKELEMRGVVYPAPPSVMPGAARMPNPSGPPYGARGLPPLNAAVAPPGSAPGGVAGVGPTGRASDPRHAATRLDGGGGSRRTIPPAPMPPPVTPTMPPPVTPMPPPVMPTAGNGALTDQLTDPQWHLLALVVRQITEHVGQLLGVRMADGLLRQSLAQVSAKSAFLAGLDVDETGWLRAPQEGFTGRFSRYAAAEGIAELLTTFEVACAQLLGAQRVQEIFAMAAAPLRASLGQIGLTINGE